MNDTPVPSGLIAPVREALDQLSKRRPVFHSEADLQHSLAVQLAEQHADAQVRLERPFRVPGIRTINLDLLLGLDGQQYAIELKYITAKLECEVADESFELASQSAQDLRRYDILKDLSRIEALQQAGLVAGGCSITLTNDASLWRESRKSDAIDSAFRLHHGRAIHGELAWSLHAAAGTIRSREAPLRLRGEYLIDWQPYSSVPAASRNNEFRLLMLEVPPAGLTVSAG